MYTLDPEERLRDMKIDSGFKSLNYAICVMCILEGDEQAEEQVRPHLPRSDVAWARSLHLLLPVPEIFVRNWLRNLLKPTRRDLSDRQKKTFHIRFIRRRTNNHQRGKKKREKLRVIPMQVNTTRSSHDSCVFGLVRTCSNHIWYALGVLF